MMLWLVVDKYSLIADWEGLVQISPLCDSYWSVQLLLFGGRFLLGCQRPGVLTHTSDPRGGQVQSWVRQCPYEERQEGLGPRPGSSREACSGQSLWTAASVSGGTGVVGDSGRAFQRNKGATARED